MERRVVRECNQRLLRSTVGRAENKADGGSSKCTAGRRAHASHGVALRGVNLVFHAALCWATTPLGACGADATSAQEEMDWVLPRGPKAQQLVRVGIGEAKFLRFSCQGGPADVGISFAAYSKHAPPLLFVSDDPTIRPTPKLHNASSFTQWLEDAKGDHYVIVRNVGPRGGVIGLYNMRHFAGEELDGKLQIHCNFIIAFDTLFWDHLYSTAICPLGRQAQLDVDENEASDQPRLPPTPRFCSGNGKCGRHGVCKCNKDFTGPACEHNKTDIEAEGRYRFTVPVGKYQYFRVLIPPAFPGGYLKVTVRADEPLVVLLGTDRMPTVNHFNSSNFYDWLKGNSSTVLTYKVPPVEASHVAAKDPISGALGHRTAGSLVANHSQGRFAYVGVFNHKNPWPFDSDRDIRGDADITLVQDQYFQLEAPSTWMAALYNPFHDVTNLATTDSQLYPEGQQYIYSLNLNRHSVLPLAVRLYWDRVTLLHLEDAGSERGMELQFVGGPSVQAVLSSSHAAPKSFFDFDQVHLKPHSKVDIGAAGKPIVWCAIFGDADGSIQIWATEHREAHSPMLPVGTTLLGALIILCGMGAVGVFYSKAWRFGDTLSAEAAACGESCASLVVERNAEDEYLHRGGIGDDGI